MSLSYQGNHTVTRLTTTFACVFYMEKDLSNTGTNSHKINLLHFFCFINYFYYFSEGHHIYKVFRQLDIKFLSVYNLN